MSSPRRRRPAASTTHRMLRWATAAVLAAGGSATATPGERAGAAGSVTRAAATAADKVALAPSSWPLGPAGADAARRDVIVVIEGPTATERLDGAARAASLDRLAFVARPGSRAARAAATARLLDDAYAAVAATQAAARAGLLQRHVPVVSAYDSVANALLVSATRADVDALSVLSGVARILPAPDHRLSLAYAAPHIGADAVAQSLGIDGRGVTIGIIDTGIDYMHAAFGGPGTAAAYAADDHAIAESGTFPTAKVIGGYDFAGSSYGGSGPPVPDDDPIDENGHGTHVAGIAAGRAWSGSHGGVAPGAQLVALKVFGASGSTNLAYDAIEWAVEAKLGRNVPGRAADIDVLNLSLGSAWAASSAFEQAVIDRAVGAGIVVVGAAGNDGDVAFVTGGPGDAPSAIGVASTVGPGQPGDRVQAEVDGVVEDIEAIESHPSLGRRMSAIGRLVAPAGWIGRACAGDAVGAAPGRVALLERGLCPFRDKVARAAAAGAVAAVIVDTGGGLVPMGSDGDGAAIPAYMIGAADGQRLRAAIEAGATVLLRLDEAFNGTFPRASLIDTVSGFSSRGITRDGTFKPDLAAPGTGIRAPAVGTGARSATLSGTSMASPMVAGAAAVVIEALGRAGHPLVGSTTARGVTPADVRAVLMSTAFTDVKRHDAREAGSAPFARRGAGRVALGPAVRSRTVLRPVRGAALSFGAVAADRPWSRELPFVLRNLSDTPRRYALSVAWSTALEATSGVRFAPAQGSVTVAANATWSSSVLAEIVPSALAPYTLRGGTTALNGEPRLDEAERDAYLVATEIDVSGLTTEGGDVARTPIWTFARGASTLRTPETAWAAPGTTAVDLKLSNTGAQEGRVDWFALLATDPVESTVPRPFNAVHVGARVTGAGAARRIELAVVLAEPSLSPFEAQVEAALDLDRNGTIDRWLVVDDASAAVAGGGAFAGTLVTVATDGGGRAPTVVGPADVDVNSGLIVLTASTASLAFADDQPIAFDVAFETTARFGGARLDGVPDGGVRGARLVQPLRVASATQPFELEAPTRRVGAGSEAVSVLRLTADPGTDEVRLLALFPDNVPGQGDVQIVTVRRGPNAPPSVTTTATATAAPTVGPVAEPSGTATRTPSPSASPASATASPSPMPSPSPTPTPSPLPTDEPTLPPRRPTVVLPVEPTATDTPSATRETAAPQTSTIHLPFAFTYVRRRPR